MSYLYLKNLLVLLSERLERSWALFSVDILALSSKNLKTIWTGNNICIIFCKNTTMSLCKENYKYFFFFLHNSWRGSASLQSPLIKLLRELSREVCPGHTRRISFVLLFIVMIGSKWSGAWGSTLLPEVDAWWITEINKARVCLCFSLWVCMWLLGGPCFEKTKWNERSNISMKLS